jgi:hypothetical protein
MDLFRLSFPAAVLSALVACSPALNWRQTKPAGAGVGLLFPCRPDRHERTVRLAGVELGMQMHSCEAAGALFSIGFVDVPDLSRVVPVLAEMRAAAVANVEGTATAATLAVPGATPNQQSALLRIDGHLPDGRRVVEHVAFFVRGARLYQATALGDSLSDDALESFFGSIKLDL